MVESAWPEVPIITQPSRGKGDELRASFEAATADIIVMIDAEAPTTRPRIPHSSGPCKPTPTSPRAPRFIQGGGTVDLMPFRRLGNALFTLLSRVMFHNKDSGVSHFLRHPDDLT